MDKELACWLQAEEEAVEEACQGRDAATLEVVMEAARLLNTWLARRFGGTHWTSVPWGGRAEPLAHGCGGSAAHGGGLATPLTLTSGSWATAHISYGSTATCARFCIAHGCSCDLLTLPRHSCGVPATLCPYSCYGFLATLICPCSCPCGWLTSLPIWASRLLGHACPLQVPKLQQPGFGWGSSEGGVAGASLRPRGPWPSVALHSPPLPPSNWSFL